MGRTRPTGNNRHVTKYLAPNERVVLELRQHWARILPAITSCVLGLVLVLFIGFAAPSNLGFMTNAAWWLWLVLVLHLVWRFIEWWDETFVVTNRRIILVSGILVKKVAMMPLSKVTDMSYNRSLVARALGYGTFVMESAGQEQALSTIDYVRQPDAIYRSLCSLIFGDDEDRASTDWDDDADASSFAGPESIGERERHERYETADARRDDWYDTWQGWHHDWEDDESPSDRDHDGTTRPMPVRSASRRRDVDDTDPYGLVTDHTPVPHRAVPSSYADPVTRGESDLDDESAWSVSHEHATRPQPVNRSRHVDSPVDHWDDA